MEKKSQVQSERRPAEFVEGVLRNFAVFVERRLELFAKPGKPLRSKFDGWLLHVCR